MISRPFRFTTLRAALAASALLTLSMPASALDTYFLNIDSIKGGSVIEGHEEAIDIQSFNWGVSVSADGAGGRTTARPVFSDFLWTQTADVSTPMLFQAVSAGRALPKATFEAVRTLGGGLETYFQMEFDKVIITSMPLGGSSGGAVSVVGSFAYQAVTMTYWGMDPRTGATGTPVSATYNLETGQGDLAALSGIYSAALIGAPVVAVPEPQSYAMLLAGLGLVSLVARRRKR